MLEREINVRLLQQFLNTVKFFSGIRVTAGLWDKTF